jgi:hypothetical protein
LLYQHFAARTKADRDVKRGDGGGDRMSLVKRVIAALLLTGAAALLLASSALAQERVGVVTNIEGFATVARVALPEPKPLHFKDDLFLRDRITTGERSIVRVLLGGKATVTARERSVLTITEVPGVATINLGAGRIAVAVAKGLMKPGEVIQIKTPNAVTAIRGTVVIAEVEPVPQGYQSTITILRGLVDVTRLDPAGALTGPAVKVGALERVTVVNAQPVPSPQKITRDAASHLAADFSVVPKNAPAASAEALGAEVKDITMRDAMQIIGELSPAPPTGTSGQGGGHAQHRDRRRDRHPQRRDWCRDRLGDGSDEPGDSGRRAGGQSGDEPRDESGDDGHEHREQRDEPGHESHPPGSSAQAVADENRRGRS